MPEMTWITDEIFTVTDFFTPEECLAHIHQTEAIGYGDAPITTAFGPQMRKDVRNNTRVMVDDEPLAERLFQALAPRLEGACARPVGLNERLRYYKYGPTECFRWHHDGSFRRDNGEASELTFMVYLNDGFEGGATEFEWPELSVEPREGMAIVFTHRVRHQGAPVVRGTKYVLRSDVMFRAAAA